MKKFFLFTLLSVFMSLATAQTVENIRVEQNGEKLNIHYRIGGSTSEQLYFVTLTCSIDGGPIFEPKSVDGDVRGNIRGGKSFNTISWDVFKDVEEVGSAEFFVKVDLTKDESIKEKVAEVFRQEPQKEARIEHTDYSTPPRKIFIGYAGSVVHPLGFRVATLGNWGAYGHMRYGGYDSWTGFYWLAMEAGVTKRFFNREKFRLHGYLGIGAGDYLDGAELDYGILGVFNNRLTVGFGGNVNPWYVDGNFSIGVVF